MAEPGILYAALLGQGLVWTTGHCLGMCGPLIVAFRLGARADGGVSGRLAAGRLLAYQGGRAIAYAVGGALAGALGGAFAGPLHRGMPWVALAVALWCLALAAMEMGWLRPPSAVLPRRLAGIAAAAQAALARRGWPAAALLGGGMAFLPCAVTAWALSLAALSGSPGHGAALMVLLVLLTTPFLLAAALIPAALSRHRLLAGRILVPLGLAVSGLLIAVLALRDLLGLGSAFCHA